MLMTRDARLAAERLHVVRGRAADANGVAEAADPAHAFLRSSWFEAAAAGEVSNLLALRSSGTPLAAIPLARRRLGPFHIGEVPGSYWPFRSFPIAADADDEELIVLLRRQEVRSSLGPAWRLGPLFDDDPTAVALARVAEPAGWTMLKRKLGTCFEIDVRALQADGSWPRPSTLKKNRWRERRLAELGTLQVRTFTGGDWTFADRDAIAHVEANSWLSGLQGGAATQFQDPAQRGIWERMAEDPPLAAMIFGSILIIDEVPAAFTFGLEVGTTRYYIANNYDERFARHSPGKILLCKDFEQCAARGIERISWGSGDAGYKSEMGAQAGPEIIDLLFVRSALLALPLRRVWTGSFSRADGNSRKCPERWRG